MVDVRFAAAEPSARVATTSSSGNFPGRTQSNANAPSVFRLPVEWERMRGDVAQPHGRGTEARPRRSCSEVVAVVRSAADQTVYRRLFIELEPGLHHRPRRLGSRGSQNRLTVTVGDDRGGVINVQHLHRTVSRDLQDRVW